MKNNTLLEKRNLKSSSQSKLLILSGLVDAQISGNQSYPHTIAGLSKSWELYLLSGIPKEVENINYSFSDKIFTYQNRGSFIYKNLFLKLKGKHKSKNLTNQNDALADYNNMAAFLMNIFSFFLALKLVIQYFSDAELRKIDQIYCYENIGIIAGIIINKVRPSKKIVRRYQGTPIPIINSDRSLLRHASFMASIAFSKSPIIMANDGTFGDIIAEEYSPSSPIFFCRNGLPNYINDFSSYEKKNISNKIKIIAVSKLKAWKRVDKVFNEVSKIAENNKNFFFSLDVIGDGPEFNRLEKIKSDYESRNLNINMQGAYEHMKVLKVMVDANLFVSLYDVSNLGNPLLEALFLKIPILTKREVEIEKILGKNYPGYINSFQNDDISNFLKICKKYLLTHKSEILTWDKRMNNETDFLRNNGFHTR